jgi:hypothetical protein
MPQEGQIMKQCTVCFEEIDSRARACRYCGHWQKRGFVRTILPILIFMAVMVVYGESLIVRAHTLSRPSQEGVAYNGQIVVTQSEMFKGTSPDGDVVYVVGKLRNESDVEWDQIEVEAQFFDPQGKLIDADVQKRYVTHLLPHGEMAFKVRTVADRPLDEYATYKVSVKSAEDIRSSPW